MTDPVRVLLTGATGFVGAHVHPALEAAGYEVLCATRHPDDARRKDPSRRYCYFDLQDPASIKCALGKVDRALYLAHSMGESGEYAEVEEAGAVSFRDLAAARGLDRIVYLGGMRPSGRASKHLRSRLRTGEILREGSVPTVELQATMILGGGSESFRIVRDIAARLPWMLLPTWLHSLTEPVAIADVVSALVCALDMPMGGSSQVFAAPGPERLTGRQIIVRTAHLLGHEPRVIDVPVVTPRLSSYWIRLVTRANPQVATELIEGLRSDILASGPQIWSKMPDFQRTPFDEAVRLALREEETSLPASTRLVERALHNLARA
jgi:uncharacterized protein YbjT (DUF2867 family)